MDVKEKKGSGNQSTEKAFAVLELLAQNGEPMRLNDIAAALSINVSTTLRFIKALQNCGYVEQEAGGQRYYMSYKICRIANFVSNNTEMRSFTHPYLVALCKQFHEGVCVSVEQNMYMVYVDVASDASQNLTMRQKIGNVSPMHCTANGKLLLLNYSEQELDRYIANQGLAQYTPNTIVGKYDLLHELEAIRTADVAYDHEEREAGVRCIACPIRNYTGKIVAGISITGPSTRMTDPVLAEMLPTLRRDAQEISAELGYVK